MSPQEVRRLGRFGPHLVAVSFLTVVFGFYGTLLPFGFLGILGGALIGLLWSLVVGFLASRLIRRDAWRARLANAPLFLGIIALGLMIGGGFMYASMMDAALSESSTTYAVLSALMQPAVPFYIALNSAMEMLLVALIVFWNWNTGPRRRALVLAGVAAYFATRIWTYLVFAETRLDISQQTLSAADVEWFKRTLATDFRIVLNLIANVCFILAAFVPVTPRPALRREMAGRERTASRWVPQPR